MEAEAGDVPICLANVDGMFSAVNNVCPHRNGPLGQGWLEGNLVVCPWHSWTFNLHTGDSEYPVKEHVAVYPLRIEADTLFVDIERSDG